jgi:hypothetical protein
MILRRVDALRYNATKFAADLIDKRVIALPSTP